MTPQPRGTVPPEHEARIRAALAAKDRADEALKDAVADALKAGASVREVAKLGFSTNTVQRWGRERGWPTLKQRRAWAESKEKADEFKASLDAAEALLRHVDQDDE